MHAERRRKFLEAMGDGGVAVIQGARLVSRSNDTDYPFRQSSDFWYLTGFDNPHAVAVLRTDGMHGTSHWPGLDVHDVGNDTVEGRSRALEPGMACPVEPGLSIPAHDVQAPEALRGIGVRIEDDVVVTEHGHENLTAAIPNSHKMEAWVRGGEPS